MAPSPRSPMANPFLKFGPVGFSSAMMHSLSQGLRSRALTRMASLRQRSSWTCSVPRPLIARPGQKPKTNDFDTLSPEQGLSPRDLHGRLFVDKSLAHIVLFAVSHCHLISKGELMFTKTTYLVREHVG